MTCRSAALSVAQEAPRDMRALTGSLRAVVLALEAPRDMHALTGSLRAEVRGTGP